MRRIKRDRLSGGSSIRARFGVPSGGGVVVDDAPAPPAARRVHTEWYNEHRQRNQRKPNEYVAPEGEDGAKKRFREKMKHLEDLESHVAGIFDRTVDRLVKKAAKDVKKKDKEM